MRVIYAVSAVISIAGASAFAQPAAPDAPPPGTLATIHESHAQDALGNRRDHVSTTYRNGEGVAKDSTTRSVTAAPPAPPPVTSTTSTATQTVTAPR